MAPRSILLHLFVYIVLLCRMSYCVEQSCMQENPCLCRFNDLKKVDLWRFPNDLYNATTKNVTYFLSICEDYTGPPVSCGFNKTDEKTNKTSEVTCVPPFSLCKCDSSKNSSEVLGSVKNRNFVDVATEVDTQKLVYTKDNEVKGSVLLVCSEMYKVFLFVTVPDQLLLLSNYVCPVLEEAGMSTGTILIIIFFFFLLFYFVFGALLLHFIRGAQGIEMIPNLEFWKDLPLLIRDGTVFLLNGCKPTALVTSEAYDRI